MDALVKTLLEHVSPHQIEMAAISLGTIAICLAVRFISENLRWEMPEVLSWTRAHFLDEETDGLVKAVCSPAPIVGDTLPVWAGALTGWFSWADPTQGAIIGGTLAPLLAVFVLGIRSKTNTSTQIREALCSLRKMQNRMDRSCTRMRKQIDNNSSSLKNRGFDTLRVVQLIEDHGRKLRLIEDALTGDDREALKMILGDALEVMIGSLRQEVHTEIQKCYGMIQQVTPELAPLEDETIAHDTTDTALVIDFDDEEFSLLDDTVNLPLIPEFDDPPQRTPKREKRRRRRR